MPDVFFKRKPTSTERPSSEYTTYQAAELCSIATAPSIDKSHEGYVIHFTVHDVSFWPIDVVSTAQEFDTTVHCELPS